MVWLSRWSRPRDLALLAVIAAGAPSVQGAAASTYDTAPLRLSGAADWQIQQSSSTLDGRDSSATALVQSYSVDLSGIIWDPRFNHFSAGIDLTESSRETTNDDRDTSGIGYRVQTTFFPGRRLPISFYGRRSVIDATGAALAGADRETDAWGARMAYRGRDRQSLNLQYDRTTFDLISPLSLKERRSTGLASFDRQSDRGEFSFRYGYQQHRERVNDVEWTRNNFLISDRRRLGDTVTLRLSGSHTMSDASFSSGRQDDLALSHVSTSVDVDPSSGPDMGFTYDYNDNRGQFAESTSHAVTGRSRFKMGDHWTSNLSLRGGRIRSSSDGTDLQQSRVGAGGGVTYRRSWRRVSVNTGAGAAYSKHSFDTIPDRRHRTLSANVGSSVSLGRRSHLSGSVSAKSDETDTSGVVLSYDEVRAQVKWSTRVGPEWRLDTALTRRDVMQETVNLGDQESVETSANASLSNTVGGATAAYTRIKGISEFFPDPTTVSPFLPGTDLVSQTDIGSLTAFARPTPHLHIQLEGRLERRDFTTIGRERVFSYHPRIRYDRSTWTLAVGISHYQRDNNTDFTDDTWMVKIGKRFY